MEYSSTAADFFIDGKYTFEVGGSAKEGRQTAEVSNAWIAADEVWGIMRFKICYAPIARTKFFIYLCTVILDGKNT